MNIILSAGGTGGHINPAIAIADALKKVNPKCQILFVGTEKGMESNLVPLAGYPIWYVDVSGFQRRLTFKNVSTVIKTFTSIGEARKIIEKFSPKAVIGTGGYACFPMIYAASQMGIYTALHESNSEAGLAVKLLQKKVNTIFLNFIESKKTLKNAKNIIHSGNPMREELSMNRRNSARLKLGIEGKYRHVLLSFGGSLGASVINEQAIKIMDEYSKNIPTLLHVHASGKNGYAATKSLFESKGLNAYRNLILNEYIYDMPKWLVASDLVICRAGAMTLSEIAAAGRASILIPSPNVTSNHQYKNAKVFADAKAAYLLRETQEDLATINEIVSTIIEDKNIRSNMEENSKKFAFPCASENIAKQILKEIEENSNIKKRQSLFR